MATTINVHDVSTVRARCLDITSALHPFTSLTIEAQDMIGSWTDLNLYLHIADRELGADIAASINAAVERHAARAQKEAARWLMIPPSPPHHPPPPPERRAEPRLKSLPGSEPSSRPR